MTHAQENFGDSQLRGEEDQRQRVAQGRAEMQNQRRVRTDGLSLNANRSKILTQANTYITRKALF